MLKKKKKEYLLFLFSMGLLFFLSESSIFYIINENHFEITNIFLVNLSFILFAAGFIKFCKIKKWNLRFPFLLVLLISPFGPLGSIIFLISIFLYLCYSQCSVPLQDLLEALSPEQLDSSSTEVYERIKYHRDHYMKNAELIPYQDIMSFGSNKQKIVVIQKIITHFHPDFTAILKLGLDDPSNAIRVQAATAIKTIDKAYYELFQKLEQELKYDPNNRKKMLTFAKHCREFQSLDIIDNYRVKSIRKSTIEEINHYLSNNPNDLDMHEILGKFYLESKEYKEAKLQIEPLIKKQRSCDRDQALLWMNILYCLGDYEKIREFIDHKKVRNEDDLYLDIHKLWSNENKTMSLTEEFV